MNWLLKTLDVMPEQASTLAPGIDGLFWFITAINVVFFVLIAGCVLYFAKRYRRRTADDVTPHILHNQTLEITWSVIPLLILIVVFFWGFHGFMSARVAPANSIEIQVRAKKWVWEFEYPDGFRSLNEFHVPVNRPVRLVMSSEDVLHSFFVPAFRVKMDIIPARFTDLWFQPTIVGTHQIFCTEYCGKGHSDMLAKVHVDDEATYQKWLIEGDESMKTMPLKDLGKLVYDNKGCATCHSLDGSRGQGPSWKGIFGKTHQFTDGTSGIVDENYVRQSVLDPNAKVVQGFQPVMPTFQGLLRPRELEGVIEFIKQAK